MIVRKLKDIIGSDRDVGAEGWRSRRLLLKDDNMGFSLHETVIEEGSEHTFWYKYHFEAVYLTEGRGEIEDLATGEVHALEAGTMYALDKHDKHILRANKGSHMKMVCAFNPPCTGQETHDEDGAYLPAED